MPSSSCLWHYTNEKGVIGILQDGAFDPTRARKTERFDYLECKNKHIQKVCFTNISLSDGKDRTIHQSKYGEFAIGLSQSWAKRKGLSPVIYCRKNSALTEILKPIVKENPALLSFCKQYSDLSSSNKNQSSNGSSNRESLRRYDEREWRYVAKEGADCKLLRFTTKDIHKIYAPSQDKKDDLIKLFPKLKDKIEIMTKLNSISLN